MKILTVYLPTKMLIYAEDQENVKEIKSFSANGTFWYWQVVFTNGEWIDITAPCILEHRIKGDKK